MRTTLTLDDDVAAELQRQHRASGRPFKQIVNDAIRAGLISQREKPLAREIKRTKPVDLGEPRFPIDITSTGELLATAEGEDYR
ncbi:MAG: DUF2191 domain-containing protein [Dehalococcoidia bacterium]